MFEKETMFFKHVFLQGLLRWLSLGEKCPIRSFFWSVFSRIRTEYEDLFGHFSRSVPSFWCLLYKFHIALVFVLITLNKLKPTEK